MYIPGLLSINMKLTVKMGSARKPCSLCISLYSFIKRRARIVVSVGLVTALFGLGDMPLQK